jgi:hypothetical protein
MIYVFGCSSSAKHEEGRWRTVDVGVTKEVGLISGGPPQGWLWKATPNFFLQ